MAVMGNPDRFFPRGDDRFRVEVLDDDVLVLDVQTNIVHRVPGAEVDRLLSGTVTYATGHLPPGAERAIRDAVRTGSVRRRSLLVGGGALVASGILSTGLPFAAAAASLFPEPFDGATYTEGWSGQTDGGSWSLGGPWKAENIYAGDIPSASFQIVLHATSGQAFIAEGDEVTDEDLGSGHGAYIVATISSVVAPTNQIVFSLRAGARGSQNQAISGGIAVGANLSDEGANRTWLAVAGAGGGDGGAAAGGRWGLAGGGAYPGGGASGGTGGTPGATGSRNVAEYGDGSGYDANDPATDVLGRNNSIGDFPGSGADDEGGGGGAGWAGGGGGGTNSGGGGGSSYFRTTGSGPVVTSYSIYTVARRYAGDGSTTRFEYYTPPA